MVVLCREVKSTTITPQLVEYSVCWLNVRDFSLFCAAVMIYKGLLEGYNFDESLMQPLYIPGMEAPPPLPPKKRKRQRRQGVAAGKVPPSSMEPSRPMGQDTLMRRADETKRSSISEDLYVL